MIVVEAVTLRGKAFDHTYSDAGYYIERDGVEYEDAYDPEGSGRTYTETDHKIEGDSEEEAVIDSIIAEVKGND